MRRYDMSSPDAASLLKGAVRKRYSSSSVAENMSAAADMRGLFMLEAQKAAEWRARSRSKEQIFCS